jgi:hypothetical protein
VQDVIDELSRLKGGSGARARQTRTEVQGTVGTLLPQIQAIVDGAGPAIALNPPDPQLGQLVSEFTGLANKALRARGSKLRKNRKKAVTAGNGIIAAVAS